MLMPFYYDIRNCELLKEFYLAMIAIRLRIRGYDVAGSRYLTETTKGQASCSGNREKGGMEEGNVVGF